MTKTATKYGKQVTRANRELRYVRIGSMKVSNHCQRDLRPEWVAELVSHMDIDKIGTPEVSHRDGYFYIMDGQHRIEAIKIFLGDGWEEQHIQCWVAEGLSEDEEAEIFLSLNDRKAVDVFQKFKVAVRAGRAIESQISQIARDAGLRITSQRVPGAVSCVGTLMKIYKRNGPDALNRALCLARDSYGDPGMNAFILDGFSLLCHRYNGALNEKTATVSLSKLHGGMNGLLGQAEQLRQKTGSSKGQCVAAVSVSVINRDRKGSGKLQPWFKN